MPEPSATSAIDWAANVPVYDPTGTLRAIPQNQAKKALATPGAKRAVPMLAPDGKHHWVNETEVDSAIRSGGRIDFPADKQIPKWFGFTLGNVVHNAWEGAKGLVTGVGEMGEDLAKNPNWIFGPNSTYEKFVGKPAEEQAKIAEKKFKRRQYAEAAGHELAGALPVVGPWAASLGEQAGTGDIGGATGQAAGTVVGGELLAKVPGAAVKTIEAPIKAIKGARGAGTEMVQRIAGTEATSPGMAEELTEKKISERQAENVKAAEEHEKAVEKQQTLTGKIQDKNEQAEQAYQAKVDKINDTYDEKARVARKEAWSKATGESKREALEHAKTNTYPKDVKENIDRTYKRARQDYDSRWNDQREKMGGPDEPVPNQPRFDAIEKARAELAGVPQDLTIFNQIIKEITEKDAVIDSEAAGLLEAKPEGGTQPVVKPTTKLSDYQRQNTALGEKAFGQTGNVGRVLRDVYEASSKELENLAKNKGVGKEYADLKKYTARFLQDWYAKTSPLSRIRGLSWIDRETRGKVAANALGIDGDMLRSMMGRYKDFGANPDLVTEFRDVDQQLKALPKKKAPVVTTGPELPGTEPVKKPSIESRVAEVEAERKKALEAVKKPEPVALPPDVEAFVKKPLPTPDEIVADLQEAKRKRARRASQSEAKFNRHDLTMLAVAAAGTAVGGHLFYATLYLPMRYGWTKFFRSDLGMRTMTKITPTDISSIKTILDKVPEEKPEAQSAMTQAIVDNVKRGGSVPPPASLGGLLRPDQIGQIVKTMNEEQRKGKKVPITPERPATTTTPTEGEGAPRGSLPPVTGNDRDISDISAVPRIPGILTDLQSRINA